MKRARMVIQTRNAVVMGDTENVNDILVGKSEWKRPLVKP
jgi:hypothetical protein